jgi:hypothetical protein
MSNSGRGELTRRIFDARKKGEDGGTAGEVDLGHRLEDGAGRKVSSKYTLILRQSGTDRMNQIVSEKKKFLYKSHSEWLYLPWWISFI